MSSVFYRSSETLEAVSGLGCWITTADGRRLLDAAGGAVVTGVGHGREELAQTISEQMRRIEFVHAATFTTEILERYCASVAAVVPMSAARVYPVSGGSEATETVLKLARSYQVARGRPHRTRALSRASSYHGNTLGALDLSGRPALRAEYEPWLGRFAQVGDGPEAFAKEITAHDDVAAVVMEPISGAASAAEVPPDGYWTEVAAICRAHDVLLVADEVMTGFGRTGKWFGVEHWEVSPDLMMCGKGASSGYWPLGLAIASAKVFEEIGSSFVHGFTFSHHPVGAAVGQAVFEIIEREGLVTAAATQGEKLRAALTVALPNAEIRGRGLLVGVVWKSGPGTRSIVEAARRRDLLIYPAAPENAILLGPPLTINDSEIDELVIRLTRAATDIGV